MSTGAASRRTRRAGIALLTVALLAGCGGTSAEGPEQGPASTRTVDSARGTVEVPADPQRVVALDGYAVDALTAVGVTPVGVPADEEVNAYLDDLAPDVQELGSAYPVDVERVAALRPDLILVASEIEDLDLPALDAVAATVVAPHDDSGDWREAAVVYADAVGKRAEMNKLLASHDARVAELREQLATAAPGTVTVARADPDQLRLYGKAYFSGTLLDDLGVAQPPLQNVVEDAPIYVSYEQVGLADADTIFLYRLSGEDDAAQLGRLRANPLWQRLRAVRSGNVEVVPDHWYGSGVLAAGLLLDDVERVLLKP